MILPETLPFEYNKPGHRILAGVLVLLLFFAGPLVLKAFLVGRLGGEDWTDRSLVGTVFGFAHLLVLVYAFQAKIRIPTWFNPYDVFLFFGVPFLLLTNLLYYRWEELKYAYAATSWLAVPDNFLSATVEEFFFRLVVFRLVVGMLPSHLPLIWPAFLTSLLFGLTHLLNLTNPDNHTNGVLAQCLLAVAAGLHLQTLLLRTRLFLAVVLLHAGFNLLLGAPTPEPTDSGNLQTMEKAVETQNLLFPLLVVVFNFLLSAWALRKRTWERVREEGP